MIEASGWAILLAALCLTGTAQVGAERADRYHIGAVRSHKMAENQSGVTSKSLEQPSRTAPRQPTQRELDEILKSAKPMERNIDEPKPASPSKRPGSGHK